MDDFIYSLKGIISKAKEEIWSEGASFSDGTEESDVTFALLDKMEEISHWLGDKITD